MREATAPPTTSSSSGATPGETVANPTEADHTEPDPAEPDPAVVTVRLQDLAGSVLAEGFELDLVFEREDGSQLAQVGWTDFVATQTQGSDDDFHTLQAHYDSKLRQEVEPGTIRLVTEMHIGMGPEYEPCVTTLGLERGARVTVTVLFGPEPDGTCAQVS